MNLGVWEIPGSAALDREYGPRESSGETDSDLPQRVVAPPGDYQTIQAGERGQLHALNEGPLGEWIAYLNDHRDHACMGGALLAVLTELLALPHGRKEPWVYNTIEALAGHQTPFGARYACPCCDFLTLIEPPPGSFATCPVCWWEDDGVQDFYRPHRCPTAPLRGPSPPGVGGP